MFFNLFTNAYNLNFRFSVSILILLLLASCKSSDQEPFTGYDYDPEGVTETYDREIDIQHKRTIGFLSDRVWITNEFDGARANDVYRVEEHHYKIVIHPEVNPTNNSPWYGFRIWSSDSVQVKIELSYPEFHQRYIPKISSDSGQNWNSADPEKFKIDSETRNGLLHLDVTPDTLLVSAQVIYTSRHLNQWLNDLSEHSFIQQEVAGYSHEERPVHWLTYAQPSDEPVKGVVIVYNRQHPPEVPGFLTGLIFLETLAADTHLANEFRSYFDVWAFPMINPDGVDNGHWRTNAVGVDLNRDWQYFRQPETRAIQETLLPLLDQEDRIVFYGIDFHSTGRNILYPIDKDIQTFPHEFTYRWADDIIEEFPELEFSIRPFPVDSPIAKNWTYKTFGADAVTFEVWDELSREEVELLGEKSAELFMKKMIDEFMILKSSKQIMNH